MSKSMVKLGPFEYPYESDSQPNLPEPGRRSVGWDFPWNNGLWYTAAAALAAYIVMYLSSYACTLVLIEATSALIPRQTLVVHANVTVALIDQLSDVFGGGLAIGLLWSLSQRPHLATMVRARGSDLSANLGKSIVNSTLGFAFALVFGWLYLKAWSPLGLHKGESDYGSDFTGLAALIAGITSIIVVPVIEATFCQGLIYSAYFRALSLRGLPPLFNNLGAGIMSALFFVLVHWALTSDTIAFVPVFVFALVAAEVYRRSGNLFAPLVMNLAAAALVAAGLF